jgi:hypothetical protein
MVNHLPVYAVVGTYAYGEVWNEHVTRNNVIDSYLLLVLTFQAQDQEQQHTDQERFFQSN